MRIDELGRLFGNTKDKSLVNKLYQYGVYLKNNNAKYAAKMAGTKVVDSKGNWLPVFHGTIHDFKDIQSTRRFVSFSFDPNVANIFASGEYHNTETKEVSSNVKPYFINVSKIFDFRNSKHVRMLEQWLLEKEQDEREVRFMPYVKNGDWAEMETYRVQNFLRIHGFDAFLTKEHGSLNIHVYNPKNAISIFDKSLNESLENWSGKWKHYSNYPELKLRYKPSHSDPVGIYLFPDEFNEESECNWDRMTYKYTVEVKPDIKVLDLTKITNGEIIRIAKAFGFSDSRIETTLSLIKERRVFGLSQFWEELTKAVKPVKSNYIFRKLGYDAIFDDDDIVYFFEREPQLIILNPKAILSYKRELINKSKVTKQIAYLVLEFVRTFYDDPNIKIKRNDAIQQYDITYHNDGITVMVRVSSLTHSESKLPGTTLLEIFRDNKVIYQDEYVELNKWTKEEIAKKLKDRLPMFTPFELAEAKRELRYTDRMFQQAKSMKASFIVKMPPEDFLKLTSTTEYIEQIKKDALSLYQYNRFAKMGDNPEYAKFVNRNVTNKDEKVFGSIIGPFLIIDISKDGFARVIGHEGRHRAAALIAQGTKKIPVAIKLRVPYEYVPKRHPEHRGMFSEYALTSDDLPSFVTGQFEPVNIFTQNWEIIKDDLMKGIRKS